LEKAKRLRWFGIDRLQKQKGIWDNDITELGYKYQMTDIAASMGLAALEEFDEHLAYRQKLYKLYCEYLKNTKGIRIIGAEYQNREHAAWLLTAEVDDRDGFMSHLRRHKIESSQVHFRNDRYTIFGGRQEGRFTNMDVLEDRYIVLPLHAKVSESDVKYIAEVIQLGW
jgi:dTDP-4-amino-4,6-dideoxygalactose transaminase